MWNELGISGGTAIVILIALYFVIKWAVKNGIKEAYSAITGKKTVEDIQNEKAVWRLFINCPFVCTTFDSFLNDLPSLYFTIVLSKVLF